MASIFETRRQVNDPKFVVAIDFGTTYSKAAYAESPHLEKGLLANEKFVHLITDWPRQEAGGGVKMFKTRTCVWYMPGPQHGTFECKAWGWDAYVKYKDHVQSQAKWVQTPQSSCGSMRSSADDEVWSNRHGYLIDCFKLWLYNKALEKLPKCLPLLTVISDFLRGMSTHILHELRQKHGKNVSKRDIQWCITVPALWEECHKQSMEDCAEMAGLILGPSCTDKTASVYDLIMVLEPEAASIYSHNTLKCLSSGDTCVVVDLGGGTSDLVTHKRIGSTTRFNVRVEEVTRSIGDLCGGVHVDERFLEHLRKEINTPTFQCFSEFEKLYPSYVLEMLLQWGRIKATYEGEVDHSKVFFIDIPKTLAKMWKRSHKQYLDSNRVKGGRRHDYYQIELKCSDVKRIFEEDIESILRLIEKIEKKNKDNNVDFFLCVGGFSESPYVRKRIKERFSNESQGTGQEKNASKIIFPRNPDTAVVRGAVALGVRGEWESFVKSRIAKKTYGFDTTVPFDKELHPTKYLVFEKDTNENLCDHVFQAFIRRGDEVPFDSVLEYNTRPLYREGYPDDDNIEITLYSTDATNPKFVLERGVRKEATCIIPVPWGNIEGKEPKLRISVHFGGTRIRVTVWGTNFSGEKIAMPPVRFTFAAQNEREYQELLGKRPSPGNKLNSKASKHRKVS